MKNRLAARVIDQDHSDRGARSATIIVTVGISAANRPTVEADQWMSRSRLTISWRLGLVVASTWPSLAAEDPAANSAVRRTHGRSSSSSEADHSSQGSARRESDDRTLRSGEAVHRSIPCLAIACRPGRSISLTRP